jgi:diaminopimelate decarboxylase
VPLDSAASSNVRLEILFEPGRVMVPCAWLLAASVSCSMFNSLALGDYALNLYFFNL